MNEYGEPVFYDSIEEYKMARITNEHLCSEIRDLKTVLLGVEGSKDMGLYGECKDMVKLLREMNGTVKTDHAWVTAHTWVIGILALALIGAVTAGKFIGVW